MGVSRFVKAILYLAAAALLLAVSVYFQHSMRTQGGLEAAYFRSCTYLYLVSFAIAGIGLYSYLSYSRKHREYAADSIFLLLLGLTLIFLSILNIIKFGGLYAPFGNEGFFAANVNIIVLSLMPLPFFVRGFILAISKEQGKPGRLKRAALIISALTAAVYIAAAVSGGIFRLVYFDTDHSFSSAYIQD
ncbi:MAG: hypothetical protein PHX02_06945 [Oscillospiraceae bacterium]|nr:hypothetical protein [Oscillospiraceae bacterium]